jgi:hypothetical protein
MPVPPELLQPIIDRLRQEGRQVHDPEVRRILDTFFVENMPDPEEAGLNRMMLDRLYRESLKLSIRESEEIRSTLPPEVQSQLDVDPRTGRGVILTDAGSIRSSIASAARRSVAEETGRREGTLARLGRTILGGMIESISNASDIDLPFTDFNLRDWMGGEKGQAFREQYPSYLRGRAPRGRSATASGT